jgi:hypothetical protein
MVILSIRPCGASRVFLHAVKSYDMDLPALLPNREEGVLRIFHRLGRVLNPQPLGPVASTLTTKATHNLIIPIFAFFSRYIHTLPVIQIISSSYLSVT